MRRLRLLLCVRALYAAAAGAEVAAGGVRIALPPPPAAAAAAAAVCAFRSLNRGSTVFRKNVLDGSTVRKSTRTPRPCVLHTVARSRYLGCLALTACPFFPETFFTPRP
jgi:hypothetical protein